MIFDKLAWPWWSVKRIISHCFITVIRAICKTALFLKRLSERYRSAWSPGSEPRTPTPWYLTGEITQRRTCRLFRNLGLYYVGALTPYHHRELIDRAMEAEMTTVTLKNQTVDVYREQSMIWGDERTIVVFVSDRLKSGQIRGIYQSLTKKEKSLNELQKSLSNPKGKKRTKEDLEEKIKDIASGQHLKDIIKWNLIEIEKGRFYLDYQIDQEQLHETEQRLGFRMIMTNRHGWSSEEIIAAYYGQSRVEHAFRNMKNPYHLALKPQYHWTDQKIRVHNFICIIGYLMATVVWKEARQKAGYTGSLDNLLDTLNNIRLGTMLEVSEKTGKPKATYMLEEMTESDRSMMEALGIQNSHNERPKIKDVGVYK